MQQRDSDPELYRTAYRDRIDQIPLPATYVPYEDRSPRIPADIYNGEYLHTYNYVRTPETTRERFLRFYQTVTGIDQFIGRLREKLAVMGLAENTIIVYSTDHGLHMGEHGLGGKCFLYEEDLRIPMIVYDPRQPEAHRGQHCEAMVLVPDLAPTVLDLAGVPIPDSMQGQSMIPIIQGNTSPREAFFAEQLMDTQNYVKSECLRTERWKYIRYFPRTEDPAQAHEQMKRTLDDYDAFLRASAYNEIEPVYEELYDLVQDPREMVNLAGNPEYQEVLATMRTQLPSYIRQVL